MKPEELKQRLEPTHLKPAEDMKKELQEKLEAEEFQKEKKRDPKDNKEYTWEFNWKDGRGKVWKGRFTNKILSIRDRQMVGVMRARMAAGVPVESLDDMTQELNLMIAHMAFSLTERPEWAKDLQNLEDIRLVQEIYMEVLSHEATFLGYGTAQGAGEAQPG